jgi:cyclophilin family peptidyl-prolyl cis-trans isomerase
MNGLKNLRGTIAMARTMDPNSATSQFFINLVDNAFLDFTSPTTRGYGYAVFGRVLDGMEVVDAIAKVRTGSVGPHENVPSEAVVIKKITMA